MSGELMSEDDFVESDLPENLRPTYVILDDKQKILGSSGDLTSLQQRFKTKQQRSVTKSQKSEIYESFPEQGIDFKTEVKRGAGSLTIYQGLKVSVDGYQVVKSDDRDDILRWHFQAIARRVLNEGHSIYRDMVDHVQELKSANLLYSTVKPSETEHILVSTADIYQDIMVFCLRKIMNERDIICADYESYQGLIKLVRSSAVPDAIELVAVLKETYNQAQSMRKQLDGLDALKHLSLISAITLRIDELLYRGFIHHSGEELLRHYPRYLKSVSLRLENALNKPLQERERSVVWEKYWSKYADLPNHKKTPDIRQSLEEFHVMIFAQQLGTRKKVSEKRLNQLFADLA